MRLVATFKLAEYYMGCKLYMRSGSLYFLFATNPAEIRIQVLFIILINYFLFFDARSPFHCDIRPMQEHMGQDTRKNQFALEFMSWTMQTLRLLDMLKIAVISIFNTWYIRN